MTVAVVTDSTADLPLEEAAALGVTVVPLTIQFGNESLRDQIDIGPEDFFRRLSSGKLLPKTSQPSVGEFMQTYQRLLAAGATEILSIHISGKLSGTVNAARTARDNLSNPDAVTIVDSEAVTAVQAHGVIAAARAVQSGQGVEQARAAAENALRRCHLVGVLDTLEYLHRGGRIGRTRAWIGGLLNVKPLITLREGEVAPLERVRTRARAVERLVELTVAHTQAEMVSILHSGLPDEMERLHTRLTSMMPEVSFRTGWLGPVVGVYAGPNVIGTVVQDREGAP